MNYTEDHIVLAAEYALGSLNTEERAQVETMMAVDEEFAAVVQAWELRLGVLNQIVEPIEPPASVWTKIVAALTPPTAPDAPPLPPAAPEAEEEETEVAVQMPPAPIAPPAVPTPPQAAEVPLPPQTVSEEEPAFAEGFLSQAPRLPESDRPALQPEIEPLLPVPLGVDPNAMLQPAVGAGWRISTVLFGVVAVMLAVVLLLQSFQNEPSPRVATPPAVAARSSLHSVGLLRRAGAGPAFILVVDRGNKLTVRMVDADPGPGKTFQLWLTSDKLAAPRSLGLFGAAGDLREHEGLSGFDAETINTASYKVTIEQEGGSPTGQPTVAPEFTGRLMDLH
ncbi:MAG: anti-sigma factor [Alphaproteobacteria bacterium]|nr:anti-sigma factor [Alphaproteobacteria bacterium]